MTLLEWYVARSSGVVAFVLLTFAVAAGLVLAGRARLPLWPRFAVEDVHRFLGLLTGTFVWIHVLALFVDAYLPFSLAHGLFGGSDSDAGWAMFMYLSSTGLVSGLVVWRALTPPVADRAPAGA